MAPKLSETLTLFIQDKPGEIAPELSETLTLFIREKPGEMAPKLSETLAQYITFTVLKSLTSTPNLPSQSTSRVSYKAEPGKQLTET